MKKLLGVSVLVGALISISSFTYAEDQQRDQDKTRLQVDKDLTQDQGRGRDQMYGSQLMTQEERIQHRAQLRNAATEGEREQIRNENHERMTQRAKERGVSIPDEMPSRGHKMGIGKGVGGMGDGLGAAKGR